MEKLDKWADDVKSSMEIALKELDREIKAGKTEAKKILNLEEKVKSTAAEAFVLHRLRVLTYWLI